MYICVYVCLYACLHVCMYACMHICTYAYMHVCMYVCYQSMQKLCWWRNRLLRLKKLTILKHKHARTYTLSLLYTERVKTAEAKQVLQINNNSHTKASDESERASKHTSTRAHTHAHTHILKRQRSLQGVDTTRSEINIFSRVC